MLMMHMHAMTGALTPAATTFAEVTAEAHSDCTRKMILDVRRHHSTSDMGTRSSPPQQRRLRGWLYLLVIIYQHMGGQGWSQEAMGAVSRVAKA